VTIRQADLARAAATDQMDICRIAQALSVAGKPLSDFDALQILTVIEARSLGMTTPIAQRLIAGLQGEMRHCSCGPERRCWIVFCRRGDEPEFHLSATTHRHLEAILATFPLSLVLPLHEIVERAKERLDGLQAKLAREAA
jgi:hypothetical protein